MKLVYQRRGGSRTGLPMWVLGMFFPSMVLSIMVGLSGCTVGNVELEDGTTRRSSIDLSVGNVVVGRDCLVEGDIDLNAGNLEVGTRTVITGNITVTHGNVELDDEVHAASVSVKNGVIELNRGVEIDGPITLTNGLIDVRGAVLNGLVKLKRGRLEVGGGSMLAAGLHVENVGRSTHDSTYVVIKPGAIVKGPVTAEGIVRLLVDAEADTRGADFLGNSPELIE